MRVDFNDIKEEVVNNFKGGKGSIILKMTTKKDVTFISARLTPGSSVGMHKHLTDSETIYVVTNFSDTENAMPDCVPAGMTVILNNYDSVGNTLKPYQSVWFKK